VKLFDETKAAKPDPLKRAAVLVSVKAKPWMAAKTRPALTGPARGGCENCGRGGRMLAARVEQKNGTTWAEGGISVAVRIAAAGTNHQLTLRQKRLRVIRSYAQGMILRMQLEMGLPFYISSGMPRRGSQGVSEDQ
jgi:hypothetical protein